MAAKRSICRFRELGRDQLLTKTERSAPWRGSCSCEIGRGRSFDEAVPRGRCWWPRSRTRRFGASRGTLGECVRNRDNDRHSLKPSPGSIRVVPSELGIPPGSKSVHCDRASDRDERNWDRATRTEVMAACRRSPDARMRKERGIARGSSARHPSKYHHCSW
jgi:hypothetical protein